MAGNFVPQDCEELGCNVTHIIAVIPPISMSADPIKKPKRVGNERAESIIMSMAPAATLDLLPLFSITSPAMPTAMIITPKAKRGKDQRNKKGPMILLLPGPITENAKRKTSLKSPAA